MGKLINCGPQPRKCVRCGVVVEGPKETGAYGPAHVQVWADNWTHGIGSDGILPDNFLGGTRCKDEYQQQYGTTVVFFCQEHFLAG